VAGHCAGSCPHARGVRVRPPRIRPVRTKRRPGPEPDGSCQPLRPTPRSLGLSRPIVVAHDIGGAVALRALLLEGAVHRDLTLFDAVSGGEWERGLVSLILERAEVFEQLPDYAHEALVSSHLRHATNVGFRPGVLEAFLAPWRGATGQAAFYRQYSQIRQADTIEYEHLLGEVSVPVRLVWGREDRILPPEYAEWLHDKIPRAKLSWVEGAGHLLQEDAPAQLLAHLTADFPA
jgi:pimeloyl-ACP methyl ester carboxylesterase